MQPFTTLTGIAAPIDEPNIDTNQLCPTRFNKVPRGPKYRDVLFHDRRFNADGTEKEHLLNVEPFKRAQIIVADRNWGGGSSREAAVYALYDHGFRCVVAPSFGDIFSQNAVKNGLLTAIAAEADIEKLADLVRRTPSQPVTVDLEKQTVSGGDISLAFTIDPISRNQLLNGWDDVDLTESYRERIAAFKAEDKTIRPWATPTAKQ